MQRKSVDLSEKLYESAMLLLLLQYYVQGQPTRRLRLLVDKTDKQ